MAIFKGVATALITPFRDGKIDYPAMGKIIDFQVNSGIDALVVCGTTGEPAALTETEKLELTEFTLKKVNGRVPVIVGAGGNNTRKVINFVKEAQKFDIAGFLSVTPYYIKATQQGLVEHYRAISEASALPIIVYNVPSRTGVNVLPETLVKLSTIENIVAIKEASGNMVQVAEMMSLCGDRIDIYSGCDEINVPIFSVGGMGAISVLSNIMPREAVQMAHSYFDGDTKTAAKLQCELMPIIKCLFSEVNPIPVKAALAHMGFCEDELSLPLTPMEHTNRERLLRVMRDLELD